MNNRKKTKNFYQRFYDLHYNEDEVFLLPNAWDALSAKLLAKSGAKAIASTSAGVAATLGYPDGEVMPRKDMLFMAERIIKAVSIPVSIDIEAGFASNLEELCETAEILMDLGAVGINLEDSILSQPGELLDTQHQAQRISKIKTLSHQKGVDFFINARTDVFWMSKENESTQDNILKTLERLKAYQNAGADGVFVPGLQDFEIIEQITAHIRLPLNVLAGEWIKDFSSLKKIGVARVSTGSALFRQSASQCYQLFQNVASIKSHESFPISPDLSYNDLQKLTVSA